eukprot:scaffold40966_cov359-Amphora_coffeaeformis.AAC.1
MALDYFADGSHNNSFSSLGGGVEGRDGRGARIQNSSPIHHKKTTTIMMTRHGRGRIGSAKL